MPIFMKLGDLKGECIDRDYEDWLLCQSLSTSIFRSIFPDAHGGGRMRGETILGEFELVRLFDVASAKLVASCVTGACFDDVEIHVCRQIRGKTRPYLQYKLHGVVISGYTFFTADATGDPPTEEISLSCNGAEWSYVVIERDTGEVKGTIKTRYLVGED
jgi:type VI secretion system secreted protein Hcp